MKKITKFLDSVMGGIKRTCVAKALAVFAVASIAISSFAQTLEGANPVINGVEDFKGLTLADLEKASTSTNFSFADKAKVLFLYNVKTIPETPWVLYWIKAAKQTMACSLIEEKQLARQPFAIGLLCRLAMHRTRSGFLQKKRRLVYGRCKKDR